MEITQLPIKFGTVTKEILQQYQALGMEPPEDKGEDGIIYINPNSISEFNEDSEGNIRLVMASGSILTVYLSLVEFLDLFKDE